MTTRPMHWMTLEELNLLLRVLTDGGLWLVQRDDSPGMVGYADDGHHPAAHEMVSLHDLTMDDLRREADEWTGNVTINS